MKYATLLAAFLTIVIGIVGLISPESLMTIRQLYTSTLVGLYAACAVRVAIGLLLILFAPASRAPKTLRILGAVACTQGLAALLFGVDRTRAILQQEAIHPVLLRVGATVALAAGGFVVFAALTDRRPEGDVK